MRLTADEIARLNTAIEVAGRREVARVLGVPARLLRFMAAGIEIRDLRGPTWRARLHSPEVAAILADAPKPHMCSRCGTIVVVPPGKRREWELLGKDDFFRRKYRLHTALLCRSARRDLELSARGYCRRRDMGESPERQAAAIDLLRVLEPVEFEVPSWMRQQRPQLRVLQGGRR